SKSLSWLSLRPSFEGKQTIGSHLFGTLYRNIRSCAGRLMAAGSLIPCSFTRAAFLSRWTQLYSFVQLWPNFPPALRHGEQKSVALACRAPPIRWRTAVAGPRPGVVRANSFVRLHTRARADPSVAHLERTSDTPHDSGHSGRSQPRSFRCGATRSSTQPSRRTRSTRCVIWSRPWSGNRYLFWAICQLCAGDPCAGHYWSHCREIGRASCREGGANRAGAGAREATRTA